MKTLVGSVVGVLLLMMSFDSKASSELHCPRTELGETEADCPWAGMVRTLEGMNDTSPSRIDQALKAMSPEFHSRIWQEAKSARAALPLWGRSLNYDEGAKATIIHPSIIDSLLQTFGVEKRDDRIVHAGVEHTYGYLLTNLQTPFGYKRARWVREDLEAGFALERGTLGPNPKDGAFLSNVTFFAGSIAFQNEPANLQQLMKLTDVSPALRAIDYSKLSVTRLEERFTAADGRRVILRTDFVPFPGVRGANAEALIYSVKEGDEPGRLVTMFPVAGNFRNGALDETRLGEKKPIQTRYNAYISGVTGRTFEGIRTITLNR